MSAFDNHTPKQALLESLESIKEEYSLRLIDVLKIVSEVTVFIINNWNND